MIVENLHKSVDELELSVRTANCLDSAGIKTIGQLVQMTEKDLLKIKNMGETGLHEIRQILIGIGLHIGMSVEIHQALCKNYRPAMTEAELAEVDVANALGIKTKTPEEFFMEGFQRGFEMGYEKGCESKLRKG